MRISHKTDSKALALANGECWEVVSQFEAFVNNYIFQNSVIATDLMCEPTKVESPS